jgi:hypothetical protein
MVYGDSLSVISQVNKDWDYSMDSMNNYCAAVRKIEDKFEGLEFHHVERDHNIVIDALSKLGSSRAQASLMSLSRRYNNLSFHKTLEKSCNTPRVHKHPGMLLNNTSAIYIYI